LGRALSATLILIAVCVSALTAHVGIDVMGDFALRHDTYDDVAHATRTWLVLAAAGLLCAGAFGVLWSALDRRGSERVSPLRLGIAQRPVVTGLAVVALSIAAVVAMECIDAQLSGDGVANLSDALGGSAWLGFSMTLLCSLVSTVAALRFARCIARTQSLLVRAFIAFAVQSRLRVLPLGPRFERATPPPLYYLLAVFLGRAHKRGPPQAA
jgi:hypothetical protein